jgi:hypothetical protein
VGVLARGELPPTAAKGKGLAFVLPQPFHLEQFLSAVAKAVASPPTRPGELPGPGRARPPLPEGACLALRTTPSGEEA